jgi:hypothetical protein
VFGALRSIPDWQKALLVGSTILFVLYLSYYIHFIRTMATILFSWFLLHTASHFKARVRDEESYRYERSRFRCARRFFLV